MNEQRDNSGVLFKNDRKETDNHPDYKGWGMVSGVEVWVSAWVKKSKQGKMYMSLSIKPKGEKQEQPSATAAEKQEEFVDDDIPF